MADMAILNGSVAGGNSIHPHLRLETVSRPHIMMFIQRPAETWRACQTFDGFKVGRSHAAMGGLYSSQSRTGVVHCTAR